MAHFEITGYGYNGATDATDDRIIWVWAESMDVVKGSMENIAITSCDALPSCSMGPPDVEYKLPGDGNALRARLRSFLPKAAAQSAATAAPRTVGALNTLLQVLTAAGSIPDGAQVSLPSSTAQYKLSRRVNFRAADEFKPDIPVLLEPIQELEQVFLMGKLDIIVVPETAYIIWHVPQAVLLSRLQDEQLKESK